MSQVYHPAMGFISYKIGRYNVSNLIHRAERHHWSYRKLWRFIRELYGKGTMNYRRAMVFAWPFRCEKCCRVVFTGELSDYLPMVRRRSGNYRAAWACSNCEEAARVAMITSSTAVQSTE